MNIDNTSISEPSTLITVSALTLGLNNSPANGALIASNLNQSNVSWKVGLNWQPLDDLRFRATRSDDIRAPSLIELYAGASGGTTGFTDLHTGFAGFTAAPSMT